MNETIVNYFIEMFRLQIEFNTAIDKSVDFLWTSVDRLFILVLALSILNVINIIYIVYLNYRLNKISKH